MIIYSNSDSFGVVSTGKVYSEFIAEHLNARLINRGLPGSCNTRIFRTTVRDLLELKQQTDEEIVVLISYAGLFRNESWHNDREPVDNDGHFYSFQIGDYKKNIFDFWSDEIQNYAKSWFSQFTEEAEVTNLLCELILLTGFLRDNKIKYLIWSGPQTECIHPVDSDAPFISEFYKKITSDPRVFLPYDQISFCTWCTSRGYVPMDFAKFGKYGHHGEEAHKAFAEHLLKNYLNEI